MQFRPRRSVLYMPGANARALEKAKGLPCDAIIFDLEDAVAVDAKTAARDQVARALGDGGYGYREIIVRVNGLDTGWGLDDLTAVVGLAVDALLFPKVETPEQVAAIIEALDAAGGNRLPVWLMIETPAGVLNARAVAAASPRVRCLVMGTSDLVKELRGRHTPSRSNLSFALQRCVLAAREAGIDILDGVHLDFRNAEAFRQACEQARDMGFDGKTLIHPTQIEAANDVFGYGAGDVDHARAVIAVWETAQREGKGVAVLDGQLIENLHAAEAERVLAFAAALSDR
ncbi:MAG: CoA ester lyase [Pseudomonadales bacterium]|nr:CoA ester lyase [Pseudomonadales bacterium]NIX09025.1 CoA ester lyase [Pseudomonadales bacterium]